MKLTKFKRFLIGGALLAVFGLLAVVIPNIIVCASAGKHIYQRDEISKIEGEFDCILVLGAGVYRDGSLSPMLNDRMTVACEAYEAGLSQRFIMSGDHIDDSYNEPRAMKRFALEQGINSSAIFLDDYGINTYDSLYRAVNVFGAKRILIVTQEYHLYRAIYLAKMLGAEACGVSANLRPYLEQRRYSAREFAARVKDFGMSFIKPESTYTSEKVDLFGDQAVSE